MHLLTGKIYIKPNIVLKVIKIILSRFISKNLLCSHCNLSSYVLDLFNSLSYTSTVSGSKIFKGIVPHLEYITVLQKSVGLAVYHFYPCALIVDKLHSHRSFMPDSLDG